MKTLIHIVKNWEQVNPVVQILTYTALTIGAIILLCLIKGQ